MKIPNLGSLKTLGSAGKALAVTYRSELMLGGSILGTLGAVVAAAKGGYEARGIIDEERFLRSEQTQAELTTQEKIQLTWKCYVPAAGLTAAAIGSTVGLDLVHRQDKKALAAASIMAVEEFRKSEKARELARDIGLIDPDSEEAKGEEKIEVQGQDGRIEELYLVRDPITERDFFSNKQRVDAAILEVNQTLQKHGDVDLDAFYVSIGWPVTNYSAEVGWSGQLVERGAWGATVREDGRPVTTFQFRVRPAEGFDR